MSKKSERRGTAFAKKPCVIATEFALALMAAQFAYAQQPAQPTERVEITGTRLPQLTTEGVSPVTVLNAQDIKFDGQAKVEDLLNALPQVYAEQGAMNSNGSNGIATVNLRNLGSVRNLVLMNGRRTPPGSPRQGGYGTDLNQIPAPLIERVELLTGGASAVYGSDAISGVVNFIMNDKFEGLRIDVNHSFYNHDQQNPNGIAGIVRARGAGNPQQFVVPGDVTSDGDIHDISLLLGGNFANGRGNATAFFSYKVEDPVLQANRDFSACAINRGATFACRGSATSFPGDFLLNQGEFTVADALGNTRPFAGTDLFNFGPYNYYRTPSERYAFNAFAHLDVTPHARAYTEFGFHDHKTLAQIAPSGLFFFDASGPNTIRFGNPLLSPAWVAALAGSNAARIDPVTGLPAPLPFAAAGDTADIFIGRRNIEGGGRIDDIRHTSYRMVLGLKGELMKHWNYDLFMQTGKVVYQETYRNDFSNVRIGRSLNVVTNPATGLPVCASVLNGTDPNCVPYNLWRLGGVDAAALNYLQTPGFQKGLTQQQVQGGTLSADLGNYGIKLPTAKNGVGLVLGAERRKEKLELQTDVEFTTGDLAGQGGATIGRSGKVTATELFGETRVPLIEGRQFADLLSVNASYRHSAYSTGIKTKTYGVGGEWAPVKNYRFRTSYQHAVRAANINELFLAQGTNLFGLNQDPCGPDPVTGVPTATLAQCLRTGLTAAQFGAAILNNPAGQYNFLQGGNPALKPEEGDSYTAGLVFTPTKDLTGTIDWWSITIADAVGNAPPETLLNQCLTNGVFCNLVQRDRFGTLWITPAGRVVALNDNLGGYKTTGVDLAVNYLQRLGGYGSVNLNFVGTLVNKWEFEPIKGLGKFDCVGLYGPRCGTPNPKWRHKARATWTTPWNVDLALTWRHIDAVKEEATSGNPLLAGPTANTDREMARRDYFDIAAAWTVSKSVTVRAGVNNVTDKDPPIVSNVIADPLIYGNGNTFPQVYDALGRLVFINMTLKF